ncbi:hypothetical protein [Mesorhizobium sp. B2-4-14]|nr:hypothetical protein [Mesorhizobium sp. B2-4-14]
MNDRRFFNSDTMTISAPRETSVSQARWILMPLFGLWIAFSIVGVVLG